jgi:hypothetical protein
LKIRATDGPEVLLKIIKAPVESHLPAVCDFSHLGVNLRDSSSITDAIFCHNEQHRIITNTITTTITCGRQT